MACCDFLPDNGAHVVKSSSLTKFDYLCSYGDNLISPIIDRASKLIANVDTQPATFVQNPMAFTPNQIQIINILFICVIEAYLLSSSIDSPSVANTAVT
jgi:hypothetical protein